MGLSHELARYIRRTSFDHLPEEIVTFTKLCILDWLGNAIAGANQEPIQMIAELVKDLGGEKQATLITGGSSSVANAALLNGAASHILELDDIHKGSIIHAAAVVIPAALAVAEWNKKSGKELIAAVAIGYEICYRIGEAVSPSHYYYFHNTGTCGTFGSAAAVAKLLDLSEEQIVHALGSAGTQAAGLWEFIEDGAMSKQLHPGKAAMNGVYSAKLAEKGFTAASKILEGRRGFFEAMSEQYDPAKITDQLGKIFKIKENSFKIHASCRHTHPVIDLIVDIRKERSIQLETVEKVEIKTYQVALNITDNPNPQTVYASKFSLQYCAALAFMNGRAGLFDFKEESLFDPKYREFMKKVEVLVDPAIDAKYPNQWGAIVAVYLQDGEVIEKRTDYPKGDPENPATDELVDKFRQITMHTSPALTDHYLNTILHLDQAECVQSLFDLSQSNQEE
jgi:2-methylcitrate dehydratase PrpD